LCFVDLIQKLLGRESEDLDIALDNLMGFEFATAVNEFMKEKGMETSQIGKIDSNPDRSKHLETATTKVFGHHIDFVNLRTETYQEHSRIPTIVCENNSSEQFSHRGH
jgi:tRNA nucleotidyltransferase (CCA-adding enzyme)